jgi:hypothetical protein
MHDVEDWVLYYEMFNFSSNCTDIIYLYLTCPIAYGVNLYLDLQNVNKFSSIQCHVGLVRSLRLSLPLNYFHVQNSYLHTGHFLLEVKTE